MSCTDLLPSPLSELLRFPFDDDSRRDLDFHLDRLAEEHPDIAEPLRTFREDKSSKKKRTENPTVSDRNTPGGDSSPLAKEKETSEAERPEPLNKERRGLDTKLRYTVPDMRREQEEEQDRVSRSQSAPPSQQSPADCQPNTRSQPTPPTREPVVRHIPIYVDGRDEPIIPKDFVDSPFPREKRNLSRETSPIPPARRSAQEQPTSVHVEHPQPTKHTSSVHINHGGPQADRTIPIEVKINQEQGGKQPEQQCDPSKPQPQPQGQQQLPPKQPSLPKVPLKPLEKVQAVQQEVQGLLERVEKYGGGTRQDKEYVYLDEMLTRNLLKLDDIETEGKDDVRAARKDAIRQIQRCISHLESKAPSGSSDNQNSGSTALVKVPETGTNSEQGESNAAASKIENSSAECHQLSQSEGQNAPS